MELKMTAGMRAQLTSGVNKHQVLWQNVLQTIVLDALGHCPATMASERADLIHIARAYLCFSPEVIIVADLTGVVSGEAVRKWALEQRQNGWQEAVAHPEDFIKAA